MSVVCGIGINDAEYVVQKVGWICPFYLTWHNMLKRCYTEKYQKAQPSYRGCYVCSDWLTFSNFKAWMEIQDWKDMELDKDLLVKGNREYSPDTCVFINKLTNTFTSERQNQRGLYPIGVGLHKQSGLFRARCGDLRGGRKNIGYFHTAQEAHQAWLQYKLTLAVELASMQKDSRVAEALIRRYTDYEE